MDRLGRSLKDLVSLLTGRPMAVSAFLARGRSATARRIFKSGYLLTDLELPGAVMRWLLLVAFVVSATPGICSSDNPVGIVQQIYARLAADQKYDPSDASFTPRTAKLFADDRTDGKGGIARLDFSVWTNSQDIDHLRLIRVAEQGDAFRKDRKIVTATISNFGKPSVVTFYFDRQNGRWLVDDIYWHGTDGWVLSLLLKYGDFVR